jgi:hypothetical protein
MNNHHVITSMVIMLLCCFSCTECVDPYTQEYAYYSDMNEPPTKYPTRYPTKAGKPTEPPMVFSLSPTPYPTKYPGNHVASSAGYPTAYPTKIGGFSHTWSPTSPTSPTTPTIDYYEHTVNDFSLSPTKFPTAYPVPDLNANEYPTLFPTSSDRLPGGTNFPTAVMEYF